MLPRVRDATARGWKAGVQIIAGTDTDYGPQSTRRIPDELAELVQVGIPPMDAIRSATSLAARCLGIDQRTGVLKAGLEADLIVVDRDPLADVGALRDVVLIVNNGRIAVNRLAN